MNNEKLDLIELMQEWYVAECNGDWEHTFGLKIDTLDNPGWIVRVDLAETRWADLAIQRTITRRSENDWVQFEVTDQQYVGCGGPRNLREIIEIFFQDICRR